MVWLFYRLGSRFITNLFHWKIRENDPLVFRVILFDKVGQVLKIRRMAAFPNLLKGYGTRTK